MNKTNLKDKNRYGKKYKSIEIHKIYHKIETYALIKIMTQFQKKMDIL